MRLSPTTLWITLECATHLLDYISNIELRETVQAATCKSEECNGCISVITALSAKTYGSLRRK